jgi:hypothetical protein
MRHCANRIASATPPTTARASASKVMVSVTIRDRESVPQSLIRVVAIRLGAGNMKGGIANQRTAASQAASAMARAKAGNANSSSF